MGEARPGCRVLVPFGRRHLIGVVLGSGADYSGDKLKNVLRILDPEPILTPKLLELVRWMAWYYLAPPGECARVMLPPGLLAKQASPDESPEKFWPTKRQLAVLSVDAAASGLTAKQSIVVQALESQNLPVLVSQLVADLGFSQSVIQSLARKGAIRVEPIDLFRSPWSQVQVETPVKHPLTAEQQEVFDRVVEAVNRGGFETFLMHGVTASGKTEVYLNLISQAVEQGKGALVLVPEIGLTPQIARQFRGWFGERVAILHSALSDGERFDQWRRIRQGRATVVVGTRSAVFAPVRNLGLIVVDEEHDGSYKQADQPRYNGRDSAIKRGQIEDAVVVLGSATPQLESYYRAKSDAQLEYLALNSRILDRQLPTVHIVDMRVEFEKHGKAAVISELLHEKISSRLERKEQVVLLLNRRGYASMLLCRSCGHTETCQNCSITLTFHQEANRLSCHYCGYSRSVPRSCPECSKAYIYYVGEGTEKVEELVRGMFPSAAVDRLDRDTVQRKGSYEKILGAVARKQTDILIGTQMIAKGHDFPSVTLVGVLSADQGLRLADFRSAERTFQLLTQVAGRAGRGEQPGEVVIQSYFPNHYSLKYACAQDYQQFAGQELEFRKRFRYPPYTALANLLVVKRDSRQAWELAHTVAQTLNRWRGELSSPSRMKVLGPAAAAIERLKKDHRVQILIKTTNRKELHAVLEKTIAELASERADLKSIRVDIDPLNLM